MIELSLFGPPVLKVGGLAVALKVRKSLALLGYLALEGPCSRDELATILWTDSVDEDARRSLRQEVWRLQHSAAGPYLDVNLERLALDSAAQTDVTQFTRHLHAGDLAAALALYRAPLLAGFTLRGAAAFDEWLILRRETLRNAWRAALEAQAAALEAASDLRSALGAFQTLLADDALNEAHQRTAMRLHGLLGEREQALARYGTFRRLLNTELQLEPLPETAQLAERLRAAATPAPLSTAAAPLPDAPPLVGRARAWAALQTPADGLMVVIGESGIGKTRLLEDFCAEGALWFRATEASSQTPFALVADTLRTALTEPAARARLEALEPVWRTEASQLIPELAPEGLRLPTDTPPELRRTRFLEGLSRAVLAAAGVNGQIVFDDLHWADAASLELLALLLQRSGQQDAPDQSPTCRFLASARPFELEQHAAAGPLLSALRRAGRLHFTELDHLSEADVLLLIQRLTGKPGGQVFSKRLQNATGGNPLFMIQTIRHLFEISALRSSEDGWSTPFDEVTADYAELPMPAGVGEAVLARVHHLGEAALRVLEAASLSDGGVDVELLSGALGLPEWHTLDTLETLTTARLLEPVAGGQGYRFTHDLLRQTLQSHLSAERRRLLHRRLAAALEASDGAPGSIAGHLERAGRPAQAAPWRVRVAQQAAAVYAYPLALAAYQQALDDGLPDRDAFDVHLARLELLGYLHDGGGQEGALKQLEALAAVLGSPPLEADVALRRARTAYALGRYAEGERAAQTVLALPALDSEVRAEAHYLSGMALEQLGDPDGAERQYLSARALSGPVRPSIRAGIANQLCYLAIRRMDLEAANAFSQEAFTVAHSTHDLRTRAISYNTAARLAMARKERERAIELLEHALADARSVSDVRLQLAFLFNALRLHVEAGGLGTAQLKLEESYRLVPEPRDPRTEADLLKRLAEIQVLRGDLGGGLVSYAQAISAGVPLGWSNKHVERVVGLANLRSQIGDSVGARALMNALTTGAGGGAHVSDTMIETQLARCELDEGHPDAARTRLLGVADAAHADYSEHRSAALLCLGVAELACAEPQLALEAVRGLEEQNALAASALAVRLRACSLLRLEIGDATGEAQRLLDTARTPPLATLDLLRALALTHPATPPHPWSSAAEHLSSHLSATLPADLQAGFMARWKLPSDSL
ncbi:ATP-binding protein [Deinococcus ruber]|nr:AAA family ATPase [Deinococcus ruber]